LASIRTPHRSPARPRRAAVLLRPALAALVLGLACSRSGDPAGAARKDRAVPVTVAAAVLKEVPLEVDTFGTAQSKASVTIKSQIAQVIQAVHFQEGDAIARGGLLFTLDGRPSRVALDLARAALARDRTLAAGAQLDLRRAADLLEHRMLAQADFDRTRMAADALAETLKVDQAAVEAAQIDLENCRIVSPIEGRAGKILLHAGNLVTAKDLPLVVINQVKPMDVFFSLPQAELDRVRACQRKGTLEVGVATPEDPGRLSKGALNFIDNLVDASNGTIQMGATLANQDERLWPGRYVQVHLTLAIQHEALVIPRRAVVTGSQGQSVFVVDAGQKVAQRPVRVDRTRGEEAVIGSGLKAGERVVTDGQMQLEDGTRVEVSAAAAP